MGFGASPLVMVRRRRAQLDEARCIEKIGGCNDAYHRPRGNLEGDQASTEPALRART